MATGTTEFIDNTTADNSIPEIWSKSLIVARQSRLVFEARVTKVEQSEMRFGDTVHIGSISNLTTRAKTANTAITFETATETNTDVLINVHEYAAIAVENITTVQSMLDLVAKYSPKMAYALDLAIDDVLAGLVDDFATNIVGSLATSLSYQDFLDARQYLHDANVPDDYEADWSIMVSPKQENGMLTIDHFVHRDYTESTGAGKGMAGMKSWVGHWMRIPIFMSVNVEGTNAAGHDNGMFHREALAIAKQQAPKTTSMYDIDYDARKILSIQLYGTKELRDDHGVWMRGW